MMPLMTVLVWQGSQAIVEIKKSKGRMSISYEMVKDIASLSKTPKKSPLSFKNPRLFEGGQRFHGL
jgi:hypothetical protein